MVLPRDMVCTASSGLAAGQTPCQRPSVSIGVAFAGIIPLPSHRNTSFAARQHSMTSMHELQNILDVCCDNVASAASPAKHPEM
jgi:hypothetical protein